jgi:hypothetical protein
MTNTTTYRTYTHIHEGGDASQTHTYRVGEDQTGVETMVWRATRSKNKQNIICRLPPRLVVRDATLRRNTSCTPSPSLTYVLTTWWMTVYCKHTSQTRTPKLPWKQSVRVRDLQRALTLLHTKRIDNGRSCQPQPRSERERTRKTCSFGRSLTLTRALMERS